MGEPNGQQRKMHYLIDYNEYLQCVVVMNRVWPALATVAFGPNDDAIGLPGVRPARRTHRPLCGGGWSHRNIFCATMRDRIETFRFARKRSVVIPEFRADEIPGTRRRL